MTHLLRWRRCGGCGELALIPLLVDPCWRCGTLMTALAEPSIEQAPPAEERHSPVVERVGVARPLSDREAVATAMPEQPVEITPREDAVARRLLASVFPEGVEL